MGKVLWKFGDQVFYAQLVLSSGATGSVSSGNLLAFDVTGSKAHTMSANVHWHFVSPATGIKSPKQLL